MSSRTALSGVREAREIGAVGGMLREPAAQGLHLERLDVDRVFRVQSARATASLPRGISAETTELVIAALQAADQDGLSATECGETTGLSRSSTPRYLEHLVSIGSAEIRPRYGAAGRPERRYRLP